MRDMAKWDVTCHCWS